MVNLKKFFLFLWAIQLLVIGQNFAFAEVITKIKVEGQKKIEIDAIKAHIHSKEGTVIGSPGSAEQIATDVQDLFKLGYFNNIEVFQESGNEGTTLIYRVVEKPSISEIVYKGNLEVKEEDLTKATEIKAFEIINLKKVHEAQEKIQKLYEEKGYFLAKVDAKIEKSKKSDKPAAATPQGTSTPQATALPTANPSSAETAVDETVKLTFDITENEKVRVKKIRFIGNSKLKDEFLKTKGLVETQEGGFFSFMGGSGSYKQESFDRDMQRLKMLYLDEGFVKAKIEKPQVYVTPDKKGIIITIRIEEGEQYQVGDVEFSGDLMFPKEEMRKKILISGHPHFSREVMVKDLNELTDMYGDLGYAFANVIPRVQPRDKELKVDITFVFDKGQKVYFGQVNVVGNSKTRDKVVRRELKIHEGDLYNATKKRRSLENVQRLGFFDEVNFRTSTPPETPDILNIDIVVKERNTGTITLGAGWSSSTGGTFTGQVNQANFLGKGQKLGVQLNIDGTGSRYNLSFNEPYFRDTEWSIGYDLYQSLNDRTDYIQHVRGGAISVGHPLASEFWSTTLRYKYEDIRLDPEVIAGVNMTDPVLFPLDTASGSKGSMTAMVEFDERNDRFAPSKGLYWNASTEYAGLGGTLKYTLTRSSLRYFQKVIWDLVWRNNLTFGVISSNNGLDVPFTERFLLGGPYTLRGYKSYSVGQRRYSAQRENYNLNTLHMGPNEAKTYAYRPFGGKQELYYTAELEFPLIAEAQIKGVTFFDIGQAEDSITNGNFFSDVGFGFRWFSPIGPLRFEWGFPLNRDASYQEPSNFEFSIGTPF